MAHIESYALKNADSFPLANPAKYPQIDRMIAEVAELPPQTPNNPPTKPQHDYSRYPIATWVKLRADFVHGLGSLNKLCQKHEVSFATARTRAANERWGEHRAAWVARQYAQDKPQAETAPNAPTNPQNDAPPVSSRAQEYETHLVRLREMLGNERDPNKIDRLASAIAKLEDVRRIAAGEPLPGSRRPGRESSRRAPVSLAPIEDTQDTQPIRPPNSQTPQ